ncbi:hypothetical protein LAZ67_1005810 [Cordylochernes scorpioides]|uniref:Mos1 transposase HTH domain-containing protein n=1 Tax=Cordylochernes scorpioides TaxID=51811 RepID=A0ABY6JYL2_9ARAC|nr:hypothetical protein LAZ67_1005810 [Cordylochernes scorpioides]
MEQKLKQRICIEFCVKLQISATETFEMLNKAFPNDAPKRTTVFEWHSRFKAGRISIEDDPRQGRPKFQRTDENVQKITDLIKENPRTTLLELEQDTGISKTTIGRIVTEDLKLKKTPAKFIPRILTNEQKLCRLATCEDMMEMTRTDPEWKDKIITGDETWVYGYDPETKPQSAEWRDKNSEPNLHTFKPDTHGGKEICLSRVNLSLSKYFRNFHLICVVLMLLILAGIEQNPGPKMSKQTTLETSLDRDKDIKDLINALTKRLDSWGERLESRLSAIDDRVENINQRLQQLEESSAVTKVALSQNSKKIKDLEDQLEYLDAKNRERNLIFYGIEQDNNEDCRERIRKVIEENMQTKEKINITRCHRLSRKPGAPILIEVPEQNDRSTLFKAAFNLRGTKISLSKDYSMKTREQRRVLNVKRKELVERGTLAKLRDNKLIINDIAYKVCDGQIVDANGHSL